MGCFFSKILLSHYQLPLWRCGNTFRAFRCWFFRLFFIIFSFDQGFLRFQVRRMGSVHVRLSLDRSDFFSLPVQRTIMSLFTVSSSFPCQKTLRKLVVLRSFDGFETKRALSVLRAVNFPRANVTSRFFLLPHSITAAHCDVYLCEHSQGFTTGSMSMWTTFHIPWSFLSQNFILNSTRNDTTYPWVPGFMGPWVHGSLGSWVPGIMGPWVHGLLGSWVHGFICS